MLNRHCMIMKLALASMLMLICILFFDRAAFAQTNSSDSTHTVKAKIVDGDTVIIGDINPVFVYNKLEFKNDREVAKYQRLIRNVKRVYPYAILAKNKLDEVNEHMAKLKTERERKAYIDQVEKEIRDEFEEDLKSMTITQGKILIKLIDRETGNTSYALVKELKGSFSAFFWQSLARLFGSNLKVKYEPLGEDSVVEDIVVKIQKGVI
jgi:hypothetical protein